MSAPGLERDLFTETLRAFFAPVAEHLADDTVSEVLINGPDEIYIERRGRLERLNARFASDEALMSALRNLAQYCGRDLDEKDPVFEGRFPDGARVEAVIAPACADGPCVAIRRFGRAPMTLAQLVACGAITVGAVQLLRVFLQCRQNVVVSGGTSSGKTSLLAALTSLCASDERLVIIEDARELRVPLPHVVQLEAQPSRAGRPPVTMRRLFQASLRLRPDRIVIGEVRGGEALDLLQAMTSGHGGCLTTVHATHADDALRRLETMAMMSDVQLPLHALRAQVASAIDVVVQVARTNDGRRGVVGIHEVIGYDPTLGYELRALYDRDRAGDLVATGARPSIAAYATILGLALPDEMNDGR